MGNVGCTMYDTAAVVHPPRHDDGEEGGHPHQKQEHEADDEQDFSLQQTDASMALLPQIDFSSTSSRSAALRHLSRSGQHGHGDSVDGPLAPLDASLHGQNTSEQRYGASFTGTLSSVADPTLMLGDNSQKAAADVEGDWSEGAQSVSMHAGMHDSFLRELATTTTTTTTTTTATADTAAANNTHNSDDEHCSMSNEASASSGQNAIPFGVLL